tara:strand:+ start:56 stop:757 length:702 start_codon:yes stop_codon:yes gene_type:complete
MVFNGKKIMNVAIIPARGGSKRIKNKNIKIFNKKPIIARTIDLANETGIFSKVLVTSDKSEILQVAKKYGADAPFIRPKKLSDDHTPIYPVISHAIDYLIKKKHTIDFICCIFPCTPLLSPEYLIDGYELLKKNLNKYVYAISQYSHPIQRAMIKTKSKKLKYLFPKNELVRTQDFQNTYFDCGQFYWGSLNMWMTKSKIHSNALGIEIPNWKAVDIDSNEDWEKAELLARLK